MRFKQRIKQHLNENRLQYLLIIIIFVAGLILGNFKVMGLEGGVKAHLSNLIDDYLQGGLDGSLDGQSIFMNAFINQAKSVLGIWFLGLTVIGLPLILVVILLRGFSLGFTVGFLCQEKTGASMIFSILSILPQNIVYIPFLLIWAVIAVNFSIYVVNGKKSNMLPLGAGILKYSLLMLIFLAIFMLGAFIEAYLSPWIISLAR
ncbi:MAG: stage II sporulation protein M [Syntrophomonadaceae bacterium]|nr:stage II sporulation protein M [Syntrophomonadaceae bacterium]MDD3888480.1 stage II sporulation protein M [Syntrophomonadaceae bacterium]MDD4548720.1 stage II sporulation protein M [Syntrophomonadaceae bacterium]